MPPWQHIYHFDAGTESKHLQFIPIVEPLAQKAQRSLTLSDNEFASLMPFSVTPPERVGAPLCACFDQWGTSRCRLHIRTARQLTWRLDGGARHALAV